MATATLALLAVVGCGGNDQAAKNTTKPIEVNDQQLGIVEKALKDAKIEGKIVSVTPFNGEYHVMIMPESAGEKKGTDGEGAPGGTLSLSAPVSYVVTPDGKAKKGL